VSVKVPNELSGNGLLQADLTFRRMEDFNPDEVARQIPSLAKLLEAREKLSALLAYMDGKSGAEELLGQILNDKALLLAIDKRSSEAQQADEAKLTKPPQL
jgi:type VI secretion system protein ImpB